MLCAVLLLLRLLRFFSTVIVVIVVVVVVDGVGNSHLMSSSSFIYAIDVLFTLTLIIFISSKFKLFYLIGGVNSTIFHRCEL